MFFLLVLTACNPDDEVSTKGDADGDGIVVMQDCDDDDPNVGLASVIVYGDGDGDGYGGSPLTLCAPEEGYIAQGGDCNDEDPNISPATNEVCDDVDQNCDGNADTDLGSPWFPDADEDGFGQIDGTPTIACNKPEGHVASSTDCDDTRYHVSPDADELCDGVDQNCNGLIDDDALDAIAWYADLDGDGFGVYDTTIRACTQPPNGATNYADCDDADANIHPDEPEVCDDGIDNNCDGVSATCGWWGSYDLGTDASAFVRGNNNREQMGDAVASLGDVDGDGLDEVAVSAYQASLLAGKTWILNGADLSGSTSAGAIATSSWEGAEGYSTAGRFLAGVGDVSGDGVPELLLGSDRVGEVWLVSADRTGNHTVDDADTIISSDSLSLFGSAVATAGDVDGDGSRDLLVSAPNTGASAGTVYLFAGPVASGTLSPSDARSSFAGATADYAGSVLDGGQDLDGDGLPDVVVGSLYGPASHGAVWVVTNPAPGETALSDAEAELLGTTYTDYMASNVASLGDTDGDGYGDIAIGATGDSDGGVAAGAVYLLRGPFVDGDIATLAAAKYIGEPGSTLGAALAVVGDLNSDGLAELSAGARYFDFYRGAAYVIYGPGGSGSIHISYADATFRGGSRNNYAGAALASADVTGDGALDLLITATTWSGLGYSYCGGLYVMVNGQ